MKVKVKYLGKRAETLKAYKDSNFVSGPYDFSSGEAIMEEKDAEIICSLSPLGFENLGYVVEEKPAKAEEKPAKAAEAAKVEEAANVEEKPAKVEEKPAKAAAAAKA